MFTWQSPLPSEPAPQLGRCDEVRMRLCGVIVGPKSSNCCICKRKEERKFRWVDRCMTNRYIDLYTELCKDS